VTRFLIFLTLASRAASAGAADTEWGRIRAYFSAGLLFSRDDGSFSQQTPYVAFNLDKNWRSGGNVLLNSFFETRLASIAVNSSEAEFASSQKVAHAGAGFYAPIVTSRWEFSGTSHALFLAPLATAAFDTPTSSRTDRFFTSSAAGVRLGHFRMPKEPGSGPELVSWIDVVYGTFTALDSRGGRLSFEGTLKAPGTPVTLGFSANLGRSGSARDDLRLFLGTRFDLGALVGRLRRAP
jgi:hypothetical protein